MIQSSYAWRPTTSIMGAHPMRCEHPACTSNHNRNVWADICPRIREAGVARDRKRYAEQTWVEHHAKQLKTRRYKALGRIEARRMRG